MTDNEKIEVHLDGELKYRKKKGEWIQVYCMYRDLFGGVDPHVYCIYKDVLDLHDDEWLDIEKWGEDWILIKSKNAIVVPIKPFIELLQEFAKEIEVEKR